VTATPFEPRRQGGEVEGTYIGWIAGGVIAVIVLAVGLSVWVYVHGI
jgi:hypothetical protein